MSPFRKGQTDVSAASARTFSLRWQAPPPLMQLRDASTSSAPSMVTSMLGYWSTSPNRRPALTISSLDWNPGRRSIGRPAPADQTLTGWDEDATFVRFFTLLDYSIDNIWYGGAYENRWSLRKKKEGGGGRQKQRAKKQKGLVDDRPDPMPITWFNEGEIDRLEETYVPCGEVAHGGPPPCRLPVASRLLSRWRC